MNLDKDQFEKLMQRLARAWADNETPLALAFFTEDATYTEPPGLQSYRGHNALRLFFNDLTPGTTMQWHYLWFNEHTQRGAGEYTFSLGGWANQANHGVAIVQLRDGKIASWREYQRRGPLSCDAFIAQSSAPIQRATADLSPTTNGISSNKLQSGLQTLKTFLQSIPPISEVETSDSTDPEWWIKFTIDIASPIAWHVVQELGHVLNYISIDERLPTLFMPVSPPPYLNGGPGEYLSWVIESRGPNNVDPAEIAQVLEGRLPAPTTDLEAWLDNENDE